MTPIQNTMFKLFVKHDTENYELFSDVVEATNKECHKYVGEFASVIYDQLRVLSNSVNNAGWENRHSDDIQRINDMMRDISREFGEFLP